MVHFTQCGLRALFHSGVRMAESLPPGCPIREPWDQGTLAPPPGLSRPAAPFLAGRPQGIRLGPALAWPYCPFRAPIEIRRGKAFYASCLSSLPSSCQRTFNSMGQNRVELLTPALSERCSNQLSYCPLYKKQGVGKKTVREGGLSCTPTDCLSLRKEVIQPHLPVRLPCYDFTPLTKRAFDTAPLAVGLAASGALHSDGVTGGVYKARERIHRAVLMRDY